MDKRQCVICGIEYKPRQKNQVTCGDPDCRRIQHLEYMSRYGKAHRKEHAEYNRAWMARKRAEEAEAKGEAKRIKTESSREARMGMSYAERQKARTLAMIGGIEL